MEPSPIRNNGPYVSREDAESQFDASTYGIPGDDASKGVIVLREALMMAGVLRLSSLEETTIIDLSRVMNRSTVQVIVGWIIRAHLMGVDVEPINTYDQKPPEHS